MLKLKANTPRSNLLILSKTPPDTARGQLYYSFPLQSVLSVYS